MNLLPVWCNHVILECCFDKNEGSGEAYFPLPVAKEAAGTTEASIVIGSL
jgi:hypothetical protein